MTAYAGRVEAQFTLTATLTASFTCAAGTTVVSFLAGDYYWADWFADLQTQLGGDWALSFAGGEGAPSTQTGKVTIDAPAQHPFDVIFTSADIASLLGFAADIGSTSAPQTGTLHALGVWLPAVVKFTRHGDSDPGTPITDFRQTVGPTGAVYALIGNSYRVMDGIRWEGVPAQRTRTHRESVSGESLESFLVDCQWGLGSSTIFPVSCPVRLYWSADAADNTASHFVEGKFLWDGRFDPDVLFQGWTGVYAIAMPRLVVA